ncbi:5-formyltetrahydrofolate cyclo-ligase [Listeria weihenstephanensis FSL R9-0317]|uniref:5-formyltetrahydrofolate cyclo-ligase n=1 Tax=Listeria weihenstephanensis TaxID=1006155 RepID=A0A1S7FUN2_9LIST|nr:5-formyltetrahydrofolate cyclo-ligase [Listeria weihenstephanensis]AQY51113.1 5-formyltetrahydrofolate cyclo-ligase [Listeria weihenstephanensis]EUJ36538.1 5-formyltetrahydrofolate cyclo-ligase [Listeria weihenstephanensis FSL R9-0317]
MSEKSVLRIKMLAKLRLMDQSTYEHRSQNIATLLFQEQAWQKAETIGITIARFPEIATQKIIEKAWVEGKTIAIPETENKSKAMQFRAFVEGDELEMKPLGLSEPTSQAPIIPKNELDLLIVPGVIFHPEGYRIGFGGGFYDRFLVDYTGDTISLCFPEQISTEFIPESHDIAVQKLVIASK